MTERTPDISKFCDFDSYDLVKYWVEEHQSIVKEGRQLARWVGASHWIGSDICYWLMSASGEPISEATVQHITITSEEL